MIWFLLVLVIIALVLEALALRRSFQNLEVSVRVSAEAVEPLTETELTITMTNRTIFFLPYVRYVLSLPKGIHSPAGSVVQYGLFQGEEQLKGSLWLRPKEKMVKRVPISAEARGRYIFPSITVDTGDFLGLKSASRSFMVEQEMIVRPKRIAAAATPEVLGGFLGDRSVRRFLFEDPVLTVGFHEYTGTEPMKSISWTRSAREGKLRVRRPDFTREPSVTVVLNVAGRPDEPEEQALMERTFSLARMVLEYLDRNGVQYDFRMNGLTVGSVGSWEYVTEGHGAKHLSGILEGLGRAVLRTTFSAPELVRRAVMHTGEQRGIIFVTPGGDAETEASARKIASRIGNRLLIVRGTEVPEC